MRLVDVFQREENIAGASSGHERQTTMPLGSMEVLQGRVVGGLSTLLLRYEVRTQGGGPSEYRGFADNHFVWTKEETLYFPLSVVLRTTPLRKTLVKQC